MKLQIIKDIIGNEYIAGVFDTSNIVLSKLLSFAFDNIDHFKLFNDKLLERNHGIFHLTVFNVMECSKNPDLLKLDGLSVEFFRMNGIGSISKDDKATFFIPCDSSDIDILRNFIGLNKKDLHITIGFTHKDLFHDRKNICNIHNI